MKRTGIYSGTFDPITNGHIDIIKRALRIFDYVIIAISEGAGKDTMFSVEERIRMIREILGRSKRISVERFPGLLVDFVKRRKGTAIIRGLRAVSDFEYELQMALMNSRIGEGIETVFFMTSEENSFLSSSIVKEIAKYGGRLETMAPALVEKKLKRKYSDRQK